MDNELEFNQKLLEKLESYKDVNVPQTLKYRIDRSIRLKEESKSTAFSTLTGVSFFKHQFACIAAILFVILVIGIFFSNNDEEKIIAFEKNNTEIDVPLITEQELTKPTLAEVNQIIKQPITVVKLEGKVKVKSEKTEDYFVKEGDTIDAFDKIIVYRRANCVLNVGNNHVIKVLPKTKIAISSVVNNYRNKEDTSIFLERGKIALKHHNITEKSNFIVETPNSKANVVGTTFSIGYNRKRQRLTELSVLKGEVRIKRKFADTVFEKLKTHQPLIDFITNEIIVKTGNAFKISNRKIVRIKKLVSKSKEIDDKVIKRIKKSIDNRLEKISSEDKKLFKQLEKITLEEAQWKDLRELENGTSVYDKQKLLESLFFVPKLQ